MELWNAERAVRCWWWRRSQQAVQRWREIIKVEWTWKWNLSGTVRLICKIENNNSQNNFTENLLGFVSQSKKLIQRRMKRTKTISWCKTWCWDKLARLDGKIFFRQKAKQLESWKQKLGDSHKTRTGFNDDKRCTVAINNLLSRRQRCHLNALCRVHFTNDSPFVPLGCCVDSSHCEHRLRSHARPETFGRTWCQSRCQPSTLPTSTTKYFHRKRRNRSWLIE